MNIFTDIHSKLAILAIASHFCYGPNGPLSAGITPQNFTYIFQLCL